MKKSILNSISSYIHLEQEGKRVWDLNKLFESSSSETRKEILGFNEILSEFFIKDARKTSHLCEEVLSYFYGQPIEKKKNSDTVFYDLVNEKEYISVKSSATKSSFSSIVTSSGLKTTSLAAGIFGIDYENDPRLQKLSPFFSNTNHLKMSDEIIKESLEKMMGNKPVDRDLSVLVFWINERDMSIHIQKTKPIKTSILLERLIRAWRKRGDFFLQKGITKIDKKISAGSVTDIFENIQNDHTIKLIKNDKLKKARKIKEEINKQVEYLFENGHLEKINSHLQKLGSEVILDFNSWKTKVNENVELGFEGLKEEILDLIKKESDKLKGQEKEDWNAELKEKGIESGLLPTLNYEHDIFEFYQKYPDDINTLCQEDGYFKGNPDKEGIVSLMDFLIKGTKRAINLTIEKLIT